MNILENKMRVDIFIRILYLGLLYKTLLKIFIELSYCSDIYVHPTIVKLSKNNMKTSEETRLKPTTFTS